MCVRERERKRGREREQERRKGGREGERERGGGREGAKEKEGERTDRGNWKEEGEVKRRERREKDRLTCLKPSEASFAWRLLSKALAAMIPVLLPTPLGPPWEEESFHMA